MNEMSLFLRFFLTFLLTLSLPLTAIASETQTATNLSERYQTLTKEIRCVVCQNQNIADSEAPLASDLRLKVKKMLNEGKSEAQIKDYLVARYGEFILFKPRLQMTTWLLWFFPFIALMVLATFCWCMTRQN